MPSGWRDSAQISDISPHGCRLSTSTLVLRVDMRIVIRPQGLEGVTGIVRWFDGQAAGLEFDTPLYEPVVDHLSRLHADEARVDLEPFTSPEGDGPAPLHPG